MYCEKCGQKNELSSKFCSSCGVEFSRVEANKTKHIEDEFIYYSAGWRSANPLSWGVKYFDIYITDKAMYIIKLPSYSSSGLWTLIGLIVFSILGAAIGYQYGLSKDNEKRKYYRKAWFDNEEIISTAYVPNICLEVPSDKSKESTVFKRRKVVISLGGKKVKLKKSRLEVKKLKKYVL